eukprot:m.1200974 g.1200974  ORF g.1200974 m.1200974 type:complete len:338 (+) comp24574_c0_seq49:1499-2512(+)
MLKRTPPSPLSTVVASSVETVSIGSAESPSAGTPTRVLSPLSTEARAFSLPTESTHPQNVPATSAASATMPGDRPIARVASTAVGDAALTQSCGKQHTPRGYLCPPLVPVILHILNMHLVVCRVCWSEWCQRNHASLWSDREPPRAFTLTCEPHPMHICATSSIEASVSGTETGHRPASGCTCTVAVVGGGDFACRVAIRCAISTSPTRASRNAGRERASAVATDSHHLPVCGTNSIPSSAASQQHRRRCEQWSKHWRTHTCRRCQDRTSTCQQCSRCRPAACKNNGCHTAPLPPVKATTGSLAVRHKHRCCARKHTSVVDAPASNDLEDLRLKRNR